MTRVHGGIVNDNNGHFCQGVAEFVKGGNHFTAGNRPNDSGCMKITLTVAKAKNVDALALT